MSESKWWKDQRVMGVGQGPGTITEPPTRDLIVAFDTHPGMVFRFNLDGKRDVRDLYPTLFPIDKERPKAKVKKRWECWKNVFLTDTLGILVGVKNFGSEDAAFAHRNEHKTYLGKPIHIVHEWEE